MGYPGTGMHFHNDEKWRFHRWCDSTSHFKGKLTAVSVMARRCPALCERSGGWGQKQLTLLVPLGTVWDGSISQPAELSSLCTADWEQINTVLRVNGASCAALLPDIANQSTFLLESWVPLVSPVPILPQTLLQNAWRMQSVHEIVAKLLKCSVPWVVLQLGSQGLEYSGLDIRTIMTERKRHLLKGITWTNYPKEIPLSVSFWGIVEKKIHSYLACLIARTNIRWDQGR